MSKDSDTDPLTGRFVPSPLTERFWKHVDKTNDCWLWTAQVGPHGFGTVCLDRADGKNKLGLAHRVSWQLAFGEIPRKAVVSHTCTNKHCVNPSHLILQKWSDMSAKKRKFSDPNACNMCGVSYPKTAEYWHKNRKSPDGFKRHCKSCAMEHSLNWHRRHQDQVEKKNKKSKSKRKLEKWDELIFKSAKNRAKERGMPFDIDLAFIKAQLALQDGLCYFSGTALVISERNHHPLYPSLDRLDSNRGYERDNVVIVAWWVNRAKSDWDQAEFVECLTNVDLARAPVNRKSVAA